MNANKKILLKGMTIEELKTWCQSYDFPVFRAQQIYEWMYSHGIDDVSEMTNLSQQYRNIISDNCNINTLEITSQVSSKNNKTIKYVFSTKDGQYIESVSMIGEDGRHTVCISSQSGCSLACDFCATAKMGLMKNLSTGEILDQLIIIRKLSRKRIDNVVYMGMGEPFLNYDNVIKSANIINSKKGFNISINLVLLYH